MTRLPLFDHNANKAADAAKVKRSERPSLDELRAKHGPTFGLKLIGVEAETQQAAELDQRAREFVDRKILAEHARLGQEPVYAGTVLVSPSLAAALKAQR